MSDMEPTLTERLRDNAVSAVVDPITAALCIDAADYIDALEADLGHHAIHAITEREKIAQQWDGLRVLRKMWTAEQVAAAIRGEQQS